MFTTDFLDRGRRPLHHARGLEPQRRRHRRPHRQRRRHRHPRPRRRQRRRQRDRPGADPALTVRAIRLAPMLSPRLAGLVAALPLAPGMRVLEVGCGPGRRGSRRRQTGSAADGFVLAIDRSARAIALARAAAPGPTGRLAFRCVAGRGPRPRPGRGAVRPRLRLPGRRPRRPPPRGRPPRPRPPRPGPAPRRAAPRRRRRPAAPPRSALKRHRGAGSPTPRAREPAPAASVHHGRRRRRRRGADHEPAVARPSPAPPSRRGSRPPAASRPARPAAPSGSPASAAARRRPGRSRGWRARSARPRRPRA